MGADTWQDGARRAPAGERARGGSIERRRRIAPEELAWVAAAPAAILTALAILVLGPPLGHLLFHRGSDSLWPAEWWEAQGYAEPAKHARYLLGVIAPLLLATTVLWGAARTWAPPPRIVRALALGGQALLAAIVAAALIHQHVILDLLEPMPPVFDAASIAAAAGIAVAAVAALRRQGLRRRVAALARETRWRRAAGLALAVGFVAIWLLKVPLLDGPAEETSNFRKSKWAGNCSSK